MNQKPPRDQYHQLHTRPGARITHNVAMTLREPPQLVRPRPESTVLRIRYHLVNHMAILSQLSLEAIVGLRPAKSLTIERFTPQAQQHISNARRNWRAAPERPQILKLSADKLATDAFITHLRAHSKPGLPVTKPLPKNLATRVPFGYNANRNARYSGTGEDTMDFMGVVTLGTRSFAFLAGLEHGQFGIRLRHFTLVT